MTKTKAKKPKKPSPFDFINAVNESKKDPTVFGTLNIRDYNAFLTSRALSFHKDTVLYAQEMNVRPNMPAPWHYRYLFHSVSKRRRWGKWHKKSAATEGLVAALMRLYSISRKKAEDAAAVLTPEQSKDILERVYEGGKTT